MLDAVRRFATKVLLVHLLLIAVVICGVILGARQVYTSARTQAQEQSADRLALVAQQTSAAIETHYQGILSDLELLISSQAKAAAATQAATQPGAATQPTAIAADPPRANTPPRKGGLTGFGNRGGGRGFGRANPLTEGRVDVNPQYLDALWLQLKGRVSALFMVDENGDVLAAYPQDPNPKDGPSKALAAQITSERLDWFKKLTEPSVSDFRRGNPGIAAATMSGYHLLAVPASGIDFVGPDGKVYHPEEFNGRGGGPGNPPAPDQNDANAGLQRIPRNEPGVAPDGPIDGPPDDMPPLGPNGEPPPPFEGRGFGGPPPDMLGGRDGGPGFGRGQFGGQRGRGGRAGRANHPGAANLPGGPATRPNFQNSQLRQGARTVVAVVPIDSIKEDFFDPLNQAEAPSADSLLHDPHAASAAHVVNAVLVQQNGEVLVTINPRWVGANFLNALPADTRSQVQPFISGDQPKGWRAIPATVDAEHAALENRIVAFDRVKLPGGEQWTVMAMAPLSEADGLVNKVFGSALWWAIFVSVSVAGILFSTSVFMIRSRVKLERARHEVLTRELEQARNIQLAWLPGADEVPEGVDVAAVNLPASHISGDFYNWFSLEGGKVAVVIGDVTGHGMAAAFLMATTQLLVKMALQRSHDPARCLDLVNKQLCTQNFRGQFVTMLVVVIDPPTGAVEIGTAGHPAPLLQRDGRLVPMELEPRLVLGVDPTEKYATEGFIASAGATLLLYTDGVVEAESDAGEQYGLDRLMTLVGHSGGPRVSPDARLKAIVDDVKKFAGSKPLLDDLTIVGVRLGHPVITASAADTPQKSLPTPPTPKALS
jgi:serine phosphatase RsbU (regulator of sigma subunit)